MPVLRIADETWEMLKKWAVPLEDTPDDALRKALQMAADHRHCLDQVKDEVPPPKSNGAGQKGGRLARGRRAPQKAYEAPILEALAEMGGSGTTDSVLQRVESKVKHRLGPIDYELLPSGIDIRWRNTAAWTRFDLVKRGLLKGDSVHGVWELTEEGKKATHAPRM